MHPCDRCTATCHVRVSCDTTGRVSLLKEALLSRFYRRTETPVHRPRPIREREREREGKPRRAKQTNDHERKIESKIGRFLQARFFHRREKKSRFSWREIEKARHSRCRHARCVQRKGAGSLSLPPFFPPSFCLGINACGWEPRRGRKKKCINFPAPIEATDAHRRRETTIHLPRAFHFSSILWIYCVVSTVVVLAKRIVENDPSNAVFGAKTR